MGLVIRIISGGVAVMAVWHTRQPAAHRTIGSVMENSPAHFPAWPGDAEVAVALTFDVDGEAPWLSEGPGYARRLTTLSQGRFGPARGLGRILGLLAELEVTATFYVPGHTADQHPGAVEAILAGGHEVGHHGYLHRGTDGLDAAAQRAELEEGLTALGKLGVRPDGYRSPGWELTPETLDLLGELGFSYDASLMADDRPYWVTSGNEPLLELPGHWSLCDWPYFGWTSYHGGLLADPAAVERIWLAEFESARLDRRAVTYTMHPEAIGRGYLVRMLDSVITAMAELGRPWFATHAQIADLAGASPIDLPLEAGAAATRFLSAPHINTTSALPDGLPGSAAVARAPTAHSVMMRTEIENPGSLSSCSRSQPEDASLHRGPHGLADRGPTAQLRPRPQRRRGRLVSHEKRPGQSHGPHPGRTGGHRPSPAPANPAPARTHQRLLGQTGLILKPPP
jgi:peptidoglycan-N-acetylglucosamine deacetylase